MRINQIAMSRLILALLVLAVPAMADDVQDAEPRPTLNGHEFMPSEAVDGPFAVSYFGTITGGGIAYGVKTPYIDLEGEEVGTLEGDIAFMALGFQYQQRFGSWFAARFGFTGGARIGVDEQSVLAQGVTGTYGMRLGGIARILQTEKVILSGALDFTRTDVVGMDPYGFVQSVIDDGLDSTDNDLVTAGNVLGSRLSVLAGWAPRDWLGINGYIDGGRSDFSDADSETVMGGGLAVGIDFKNLDLAPIGTQLLAHSTAITTGGADLASRSWTYGLGVFYTGWDDFSLSFEATMNTFDRRGGGDGFESFMGTFNLRYWP